MFTWTGISWVPAGRGTVMSFPLPVTCSLMLRPAASLGDVNGDGKIDSADLDAIDANLGGSTAAYDLNGDGPARGSEEPAALAVGRPVRQREHAIIRLSAPEINRLAAFMFATPY